jgi:hypothetical protein
MSISQRARRSALLGALLGGAGAGAGSLAGFYARSAASKVSAVPSWMWGIAEDALAFYLGSFAVKPAARPSDKEEQ